MNAPRTVPVLIPGAREPRIGHAGAASGAAAPVPAVIAAATPPGAQRLEYEREGGGSPVERQGTSQKTLTARLRRWLFGGG